MQYTIRANDTWDSVAASQTIGGAAYGTALANLNDYSFGTVLVDSSGTESTVGGNSKIIDVRDTITIPDEWLKPSGTTAPSPVGLSPATYQLALFAGLGFLLYTMSKSWK